MSWDSESPDLTQCFEQTVLVYVPCAFLWVFTLLELYYIKRSGDKNIPRNFLNQSKLILTAAITILTIVDLVYAISYEDKGNVFPVHFYTPVIKISTFVSPFTASSNASATNIYLVLDPRGCSGSLQQTSWNKNIRMLVHVLVLVYYFGCSSCQN